MADTNDSKSFAEKHVGSTPTGGTNIKYSTLAKIENGIVTKPSVQTI